jgi:hypothetical protein
MGFVERRLNYRFITLIAGYFLTKRLSDVNRNVFYFSVLFCLVVHKVSSQVVTDLSIKFT